MRARLAMEFFALAGVIWIAMVVALYQRRAVWGIRRILWTAAWISVVAAFLTAVVISMFVVLGD